MSLAKDSRIHSASSDKDDFAASLEAQLATESDASANSDFKVDEDHSGDEGDNNLDLKRFKRRKKELFEDVINPRSSSFLRQPTKISGSSTKKNVCYQLMDCRDDESGVALRYIHKSLRLAHDEIDRIRDKDFKNLLRHRKLCLVLDLDHTLLNSTCLAHMTVEEGYLSQRDALPDSLKSSVFRLDRMRLMTKLRPYVHTFLKEASKLYEMYIYTMGERPYALQMAKLLDPGDVYFNSRIIARGDCTQRHQKSLDVVLAKESAIVILDDTEEVWSKHKENLILMERYQFFSSSCKQFGFNCKSLSELRRDEIETEGALATALKILQQIHSLFFDQGQKDNLEERDLRRVLKTTRKEVLKGCKVVFNRVCPAYFDAEQHPLWRMAEEMGATCCKEMDQSVTHVVSMDAGTDKSHWAVEKKFLVNPGWIEASNYMWRKQPEENFPVF